MDQLNSFPGAAPLAAQAAVAAETLHARRLIVLVPEAELDTPLVAQKLRELANLLDRRIQLIGLCQDALYEPGIRRQLVTLAAIARDDRISVDVKVEIGKSWQQVAKACWQPGDRIVCFEGQTVGLRRRALSDMLASALDTRVYVLPVPVSPKRRRLGWLSPVVMWLGSLGIIAGFAWLQIQISQLPPEWPDTVVLYVSLFAAVALLWIWNSMFE